VGGADGGAEGAEEGGDLGRDGGGGVVGRLRFHVGHFGGGIGEGKLREGIEGDVGW